MKISQAPSLSQENLNFLTTLKTDYPAFSFKPGKKFLFRPKKSIFYLETNQNFQLLFLHELSHALLGHFSYNTSLERLQIERDAWAKTKELCKKHNVQFSSSQAENELDTYRDWLHKKSRCPKCELTRFQTPDGEYHCPRCENFL